MCMLKNYWKKIIFTVAIGALFITVTCHSFSISPLKFHLTLTPGVTNYVLSLTVKNSSSEKQLFNFKVLGAEQIQSGQLIFSELQTPAESWVQPEINAVEIPSNAEEKINFLISIPKDAVAGSYYLGLAAETVPNSEEEQVGVSGQLVSILLLQVAGVVNESLSIEKWSVPSVVFGKKWTAILTLLNTSVVELPVSGEISVHDWLGRKVASESINLGSALLPSAGRNYSAIIPMQKERLLPGPYEAKINVRYGLTNQTSVAVKRIWYLPYYIWIIIPIVIILGAVMMIKRK